MLTTLQASEYRGLCQRNANLESMLAAAEKRCSDQTAELAVARRDQKSVKSASSSEADRLACLEGDAAALARCSLGQLYRLVPPQSLHWLQHMMRNSPSKSLFRRHCTCTHPASAAEAVNSIGPV